MRGLLRENRGNESVSKRGESARSWLECTINNPGAGARAKQEGQFLAAKDEFASVTQRSGMSKTTIKDCQCCPPCDLELIDAQCG